MKLILYCWGANNEETLKTNLISLGHEILVFSQKCVNYTRDFDLAQKLIMRINENHVDGVISFNYFPIISMVCDVAKIKYYSWVYDCPHFTLYAKTVGLPCNRIGIFDELMVEDLRARGINTVFHLPLAAAYDSFYTAILKNRNTLVPNGEYIYDVSFVGSLYTDKSDYFDKIYPNKVPLSVITYLEKYMGKYANIPAATDIEETDLKEAVDAMEKTGMMLGDDYVYKPLDIIIPAIFEKKLTIMERDKLIRKIAGDKNINFGLYTNSETDILNHGTCGYADIMPCIFNASKVNLNITLRSIHSGGPLRVIDIMSSGGFVLSNYQSELSTLFKEDKEIVLYRDLDEAVDKIYYYLEHEEERIEIAEAGNKAVKEKLGFARQIGKLLVE